MERFAVEALALEWPFDIDHQAGHLFKHSGLGIDDIAKVWASDPLFYLARPPAHWLMIAEVEGRVLTVPLAPSRSRDLRSCRPIGCYVAADQLARRYQEDR